MLASERSLEKESIIHTPCAYADLDFCPLDKLELEPTFAIQTSKDRHSAVWIFNETVEPTVAEDVSFRIARRYEPFGADQSGWDLSQRLRVPYTVNYKYNPPQHTYLIQTPETYALTDFAIFPESDEQLAAQIPFPTPEQMPSESGEEILRKYGNKITTFTWGAFYEEPIHNFSLVLWSMVQQLFAAGLTPPEVLKVTKEAKCNKFERPSDGRGDKALWKYHIVKAFVATLPDEIKSPAVGEPNEQTVIHVDLLSPEERATANQEHNVLTDYMDWGETVTDAPRDYHLAGGLIILSSLLSGCLRLPTTYGTIAPNLWLMIMADSTLTRKSSSMDLAMDLLEDIDDDVLLATDGSIEGLLGALALRPKKPSLFWRDEFSGLLDAMHKKDYYSGMEEALTKFYDGKMHKRQLRRETITVRDPIFLIYAGGIKDRILDRFTIQQVYSGFIPRFIFITANTDLKRIKPLGPPTNSSMAGRDKLLKWFSDIHEFYQKNSSLKINNVVLSEGKTWRMQLTPEAWERYNRAEANLVDCATKSINPELFKPVYSRIANSSLKTSMLLAAAAMRTEGVVTITEQDIVNGLAYAEGWAAHALNVIINIGRSDIEKLITGVLATIKAHPGIRKSELMNWHKLTSRSAGEVFDTIMQRGLVTLDVKEKGMRFYARGHEV